MVPVRPLRPDTAVSTSLMISRTMLAVVKGLLLSLSVDLRSPFCSDELKPLASSVDVSRQWQVESGCRGLENAGSIIPYMDEKTQ